MKIEISRKGLIFSVFASIGVIGTAIISGINANKIEKAVKNKEKDLNSDKLEPAEYIKTTWKYYIPIVAIAGGTIICIAKSSMENRKTSIAIINAYNALNQIYTDYSNKVKDIYVKEAHQKIVEQIIVEHAETPYLYSNSLASSDSLDFDCPEEFETRLFYDAFSKRYFESTINHVLQSEYHLNRNFALCGGIPVNDFYDFLGIERIGNGKILGWDLEGGINWIDFNHFKNTLDDGLECCVIEMVFEPWISDF